VDETVGPEQRELLDRGKRGVADDLPDVVEVERLGPVTVRRQTEVDDRLRIRPERGVGTAIDLEKPQISFSELIAWAQLAPSESDGSRAAPSPIQTVARRSSLS